MIGPRAPCAGPPCAAVRLLGVRVAGLGSPEVNDDLAEGDLRCAALWRSAPGYAVKQGATHAMWARSNEVCGTWASNLPVADMQEAAAVQA